MSLLAIKKWKEKKTKLIWKHSVPTKWARLNSKWHQSGVDEARISIDQQIVLHLTQKNVHFVVERSLFHSAKQMLITFNEQQNLIKVIKLY